jgi:transcriptional regulator with XRE-family HTH domain
VQNSFKPEALFAMLDLAGLRSADVARALDVSRATITNWRKGTHSLSPEHYAALIRLAASYETIWLGTHRAMTQQAPREEPMPGTRLHVQVFAENYQEQMHRSFRACLETLHALIAATPSDWNYDTVCALTEELAGMARALRIIMADTEETKACPDTTPPANDAN